jgi:c(7)-type cytochrome triheme protein
MSVCAAVFATHGIALCASPDTLIFSHKVHSSKVEVECKVCHEPVVKGAHKDMMSMPVMKTCAGECHGDQIKSKDSSDCATCHKNVKAAGELTIDRSLPRFNHNQHPAIKTNCIACHAGIELADKSTTKPLPAMPVCIKCHDNRKAPAECKTCHVNVDELKPASHSARWLESSEHGLQSRVDIAACDQCHQQSSCDQCHRGLRSTRLHSVNYLFSHGIEAKTQSARCATCHDTRRFCSSCH